MKNKIAIIGVGLLGGSLALALKKQGGVRLVGWNHRASSRRKARRLLQVAPTFEKAVEGADIILLCAHSGSITLVLKLLKPLIRKNSLVMDVSSVKEEMTRDAMRIPGMAKHFVPCHPMAGKEKSGPAYAEVGLYKGKTVFITPLPGTPRPLVQKAVRFWKKVGARPEILGAALHDRGVALTSHLPHLLASAMMHLYDRARRQSPVFQKAVGSGFQDFTRISGGNPAMWQDIVLMNSKQIKVFLSQYQKQLKLLERNLVKGKSRFWLSFFEKARSFRETL